MFYNCFTLKFYGRSCGWRYLWGEKVTWHLCCRENIYTRNMFLPSPSPIFQSRVSFWHHRWLHNQFLPFFSLVYCPRGVGELQACPLRDVVFPPLCIVFFPISLCLAWWFWSDLMNGRHVHTTLVCVSLLWSGGLRVIRLPAGSWHGLSPWYHGLRMRCVHVSCVKYVKNKINEP